ncbi:hypothetical protein [Nocardia asiatica]|uniref:hypothetical protein n=1 Tax=Nocardia asiatica TaxID=209252 RepID=UPI002454E270|nr:hypothetical protein [Nocardia asiatica]
MSRRRDPKPAVPEEPQQPTVLVPVTQLSHLAEGARKSGHTARVVRVPIPVQEVKTPGRRPGQWLGSGQPLKTPRPQYLSPPEIEAIERGEIAAIWEGGFDR